MDGTNSSITKFLRGLGLGKSKTTSPVVSTVPKSSDVRKKHSPTEFQILASRAHVPPPNRISRGIDPAQLISYLRPSHEYMVSQVQDIERIRALCPEIRKAESILVSSIMSPNDLQSIDPTINLGDYDGLDESTYDEVTKLLSEFFAKEYHLGKKMEKWAAEALFRSGAAVVFTLPEGTLATIVGNAEAQPGKENLHQYINPDKYAELLKKDIYGRNTRPGQESFLKVLDKSKPEESRKVDKDLLFGVEQFVKAEGLEARLEDSAGLEAITARIITELEEGDTLHLSENPEVLRFGKMIRNYGKNKLGKDLIKLYEQNTKQDQRALSQSKESPIIDLSPYIDEGIENKSHAYCLELPSESVIPICIPGSTTEKLGYFVLIDAFGHPVEASKYLMTYMGNATSSQVAANYAAMYGSRPTASGVKSDFINSFRQFGSPWDLQQNAISRVFDYILDVSLKKRLNGLGLTEVDLGAYNNIAACMFYRLLEKKRTSLVFVPEELITYVAFDYRKDGTGKSRLEDIMYLLSVKTTIVIANMMAAMRNSVARKDITVTVDEEETNPEGILDEIRQGVVEKYGLDLTNDPSRIASSINNQSMTIKLKGTNAPGFEIEAQDTQSQVPKADTDLLEQITNGIVTHLGPPYSVMNETSQAEYAKSVATTNLFFANDCRTLAGTLCEHTAKYCRTVVRFSPVLRKKLYEIVKGATKKTADNIQNSPDPDNPDLETVPNTSADGGRSELNQDQIVAKVQEIIKHLTVELPAPNIAPDKAQSEIFGDYIRVIGDYVNAILPNEIVAGDSDLTETLTVFKSAVTAEMTKELATSLGLNSVFDAPSWEEYMVSNKLKISKMYQSLRNLKQHLLKDKVATTTATETEGDETGGDGTDTSVSTDDSSSSSDYTW